MTDSLDAGPRVELSDGAREALLAHVARDPVRHRFIRIHAGIG